MTTSLATANAIKAALAITLVKHNAHQHVIRDCFDAVDNAIPSYFLMTQQHETSADSKVPQVSTSTTQDSWADFRGETMPKPKQFCRRFRRSGRCKYGDACYYSDTHSHVEVNNVRCEQSRTEFFNIASGVGSNSDEESDIMIDSTVDTGTDLNQSDVARDTMHLRDMVCDFAEEADESLNEGMVENTAVATRGQTDDTSPCKELTNEIDETHCVACDAQETHGRPEEERAAGKWQILVGKYLNQSRCTKAMLIHMHNTWAAMT